MQVRRCNNFPKALEGQKKDDFPAHICIKMRALSALYNSGFTFPSKFRIAMPGIMIFNSADAEKLPRLIKFDPDWLRIKSLRWNKGNTISPGLS